MHSSNLRASQSFSRLHASQSARIQRGTADQSGFADTLGLASVHTIYPRRRRSGFANLLRASRAALIPALGGVAAAYILLIGAPMSPATDVSATAPAMETVR